MSNNRTTTDMLKTLNKEVEHHAYELNEILSKKPKTEVPVWVIAIATRAANDISDCVHYLDGELAKKILKTGGEASEVETLANLMQKALHHSEEMGKLIAKGVEVPLWVIQKMERSATDLSDITHFMDGRPARKATGGGVGKKSIADRILYLSVTVPVGKEGLITNEENHYDIEHLISKSLTKKWFGHGSFDVRHLNSVSNRTAIFYITVPKGKEYLKNDENHYDIESLISNSLTKKWFGHGPFNAVIKDRQSLFVVGEKVMCNGEEDEVVGFVSPADKDNWDMGYRLVLKENGTQSIGAVEKINQHETGGGVGKYTDYYLVVNLDERGEYSADVCNPKDEVVYSIATAEDMRSLIEDGFLRYKADEDLSRLAKYLVALNIIPNHSQIYSEQEFDEKIRDQYAAGGVGMVGVKHFGKVKPWYKANYPTDDLADKLNENTQFQDVWQAIHNGVDVYSVLGVGDSLVRERVFEELSKIYKVKYDYIYTKWYTGGDQTQAQFNLRSWYNLTREEAKLIEKLSEAYAITDVKRRSERFGDLIITGKTTTEPAVAVKAWLPLAAIRLLVDYTSPQVHAPFLTYEESQVAREGDFTPFRKLSEQDALYAFTQLFANQEKMLTDSEVKSLLEVKEFLGEASKTTKSLAWLKEKLKPGVALKMVASQNPNNKFLGIVRYVIKAQTNSVALAKEKNASIKEGSWMEFPPASLIEVNEKGFTIYNPGKRLMTADEKRVYDNRPIDKEQSERDMMTDGSVMFYREKAYFAKSPYPYLNGHGEQKGKRFDYSTKQIIDNKIKGDVSLAYEFVEEANEKPKNDGSKIKLDDIHELDLWVTMPDGRYYRRFVFTPEQNRNGVLRQITDFGVKEQMKENANGTFEFVLSVANQTEADKLTKLWMLLNPQDSKIVFDGKPTYEQLVEAGKKNGLTQEELYKLPLSERVELVNSKLLNINDNLLPPTADEAWSQKDFFQATGRPSFKVVKEGAKYVIYDLESMKKLDKVDYIYGKNPKQPPYTDLNYVKEVVSHLETDRARQLDFMWNHAQGGTLRMQAKPSKKIEKYSTRPGMAFDIAISRDLAIELLSKQPDLLKKADIMCLEMGQNGQWLEVKASDLVGNSLPLLYKTFELWRKNSNNMTIAELQQELKSFIQTK